MTATTLIAEWNGSSYSYSLFGFSMTSDLVVGLQKIDGLEVISDGAGFASHIVNHNYVDKGGRAVFGWY